MMLWHKGTRIATTLFFAIASPSLTAGLPCKNEERVSCLLGFGAMVHTGTPGTAECQETCAILPSVENSKGCGSCKISTPENAVTYKPGNLIVNENGLLLSQGLTARVIATSKQTVAYVTGGVSSVNFHVKPDMGGTFEDPRPGNEGGWIYVSRDVHRSTSDKEVQPKSCLTLRVLLISKRSRTLSSDLMKPKPTGSKGESVQLRSTAMAL